MFPGVPPFPTEAPVFNVMKQGSWGHVVPTSSAPCKEACVVEEMGNSTASVLYFFCLEAAGVLFPEWLQLIAWAIP